MKKRFDNAAQRRLRGLNGLGDRTAADWYLRQQVAGSTYVADVFSTGRGGLGVATTDSTSELMRSDEDRWEKAWMHGIWIGEGEYDESAGARSVDVSIRIDLPGGKDPLDVMETDRAIEPVRKIADGSAPSGPGRRVAVAAGRGAPVSRSSERPRQASIGCVARAGRVSAGTKRIGEEIDARHGVVGRGVGRMGSLRFIFRRCGQRPALASGSRTAFRRC